MIYIDFLTTREGLIIGFRMKGHSGYAEVGSDIVCAAVSSATYMAVNTITDVLGITPLSLRVDDAEMFFRIEEKDFRNSSAIISGLKLHLIGLEEQYPENILVNYMEV